MNSSVCCFANWLAVLRRHDQNVQHHLQTMVMLYSILFDTSNGLDWIENAILAQISWPGIRLVGLAGETVHFPM